MFDTHWKNKVLNTNYCFKSVPDKIGEKMIRALGKPRGGRIGSLMAQLFQQLELNSARWSNLVLTNSDLAFHLLHSFRSSREPAELGFGISRCHSCLVNIKTTRQKKNVCSRTLEKIIKSLRTWSQSTGKGWAWLTHPLKWVIFSVGPSLLPRSVNNILESHENKPVKSPLSVNCTSLEVLSL